MTRPLFADAPIMQAAPVFGGQAAPSGLAAALSRGSAPMALPAPSANIPLASMMQALQGQPQPTAKDLLAAPAQPPGQGAIAAPQSPWTQTPGQPPPPNWLQQIMPNMPGSTNAYNPAGPMTAIPGAPGG